MSASMEALLEALAQNPGGPGADPGQSPLPLLRALVARLRPARLQNPEHAREAILGLCYLLEHEERWREGLARCLLSLLGEKRQVSLYADVGIFPNTGFFTESARRLSRTLLPDVVDEAVLADGLGQVFDLPRDARWIDALGPEPWERLIRLLFLPPGETPPARYVAPRELPFALAQILEALRVLSYRVAAAGLEPEILRIEPALEKFASPFIALNVELLDYLERFEAGWKEDRPTLDERQLGVLIHQCREVVERIRQRAKREGTSISLTFQLRRLAQQLTRMEILLAITGTLREEGPVRGVRGALPALAGTLAELFVRLVRAECRKNHLRDYWQQNMELLALRVTDNAGRTGEHYITEGRKEYFGLWRSALGAGMIIAFMAAHKIILGHQQFAPLNEILAYCLNYGLGFVLIHMLHFTVATKQPAMTAAAIAASIGEASEGRGRGRSRNLDNLVSLIARTVRSQLAAILGNVLVAVPMAMVIGIATDILSGSQLVSPDKARHLLADVHPFQSGALLYAGVAGVCLFLAGLISGYYDNLCAYNRIPERLLGVRWLNRWLGEKRLRRVARYLEDNLGALAGNFFFGFLLGGMWGIGVLFGLPLDIRHIAFSSAFVGFALVGLNFHVSGWPLVLALLGVAGIGLINLLVSFSLALLVALKSRGLSLVQTRGLLGQVLARLLTHPREFFLPPRKRRAVPVPESEAGGGPGIC